MPVPTEPGPHYWRSGPDAPWQIVEVSKGARGLEFEIFERYRGEPGAWCWYDVDMEWGEWGERIPDSPTLKAMRQLARTDPWLFAGECGWTCRHCRAVLNPREHPDMSPAGVWAARNEHHKPGCPWLLAQEKTDANAD